MDIKKITTKISNIFKAHSALLGSFSFIILLSVAVFGTYTLTLGKSSSANQTPVHNADLFTDSLICFKGTDITKFESSKILNEETYRNFTIDDYSEMSYGETNARVNVLQCRLDELGFLNIDELTEYFGPATRQAVEAFQRQHGLTVTGIADSETLMQIFTTDAERYVLYEGVRGDDVRDLQEQLCELAYMEKATGFYGELTVKAIKDFQKRNSIKVTGIADYETVYLLYMPNAIPGENYTKELRRKAKIDTFLEVARQQLGKPYSSGSRGPKSFDCSGFVHYCLREAGSNRRRLSSAGYSQVNDWEKIQSMNDLQPGDLLFFYNSRGASRVGHVGIYLGKGYMIDASTSEGKIVKRSCMTKHWRTLFLYARRPW